jgi:O-antigen/teichoic acid export membrane protein
MLSTASDRYSGARDQTQFSNADSSTKVTLKQKTFSAIRWTTAAMAFRVGLSFVQVAIVARLLNPSDFGLMALCGAVMAFVQIFADMGVSNAIVHHRDISRDQISSLYWLNILSGLALTMLMIVASPFISAMYDEPRLLPILILMSTTLAPLGSNFVFWRRKTSNSRFSWASTSSGA